MAKVFITGATGQVGSHLAYYIAKEKPFGVKDGSDIFCLVRNPSPKRTYFLKKYGINIVEGTLLDKETINQTLLDEQIDYVFHAAANPNPAASFEDIYPPNVIGTRNVLEAFNASRGRSFVFCSSIAVYGAFMSEDQVTVVDETSPLGSLTENEPYPVTKIKSENMIQNAAADNPDKQYIITRIGVIIGPRDTMVLPTFVQLLSMPFIPKLIANGRDYIAITSPLDVARGQVFLAKKGPKISGEVFNIAGEHVTYRQVYKYISKYFRWLPPQISVPMWSFNMFKPIFPYLKDLFPDNDFVQKALSPSAIEFIGKSFIYKTDKLENLGFEFMVSAEETITAALKYSYPSGRLREPFVVRSWKENVLNLIEILDDSIEDIREKVKYNCLNGIDCENTERYESQLEKARADLRKALELEEKAQQLVDKAKEEKKEVTERAKLKLRKARMIEREAKATKEAAEKALEQCYEENMSS